MSTVKNLNPADIALCELARGEQLAPQDVFRTLEAKGYVKLQGSRPTLTAKGKARAQALKDAEHDLRLMFVPAVAAGKRCPITTAGGGLIRT